MVRVSNFALAVGLMLCIPAPVLAQSDYARTHQTSAIPDDARYELVQSHIAARGTFKLNRFTGDVYQMVLTPDSVVVWERLEKRPHPQDGGQVAGSANYQLFLSGLGMRHTYLINVRTGATWQLVETTTGALAWNPVL